MLLQTYPSRKLGFQASHWEIPSLLIELQKCIISPLEEKQGMEKERRRSVEGLSAGTQRRGYTGGCISTGLISDGQFESFQLSSGHYVNTVNQLALKIHDHITSFFYWKTIEEIKTKNKQNKQTKNNSYMDGQRKMLFFLHLFFL